MAEAPPGSLPTDDDERAPGQGLSLVVNAQFVKDLSFENPRAPASLVASKEAPQIDVNVNVNARNLSEGVFEVTLAIRADARIGDEPAFITELVYGGVFTVMNMPEDTLRPILLIECPRLLFPFARRIIADVTRDGGFPPLFINPIDFVALYRRQFALQDQPAAGQA
jgi:preprotein translocase subunit SecB